jgi:16S rRNA (adenine1518-N6/adenine1519-N6)-dimethyltransferase
MPKRNTAVRARPAGPRAKKSLGQHFLKDPFVLQKIARAVAEAAPCTVLEVGPGTGNLTAALLEEGLDVVAVEIDQRMYDHLRERFRGEGRFRVIPGSALEVEPRLLLGRQAPYTLAGNLPYFLASAIVRHFLESDTPPQTAVVMVQKEVAREWVARAGDMSLASVGVQVFARPRVLFDVAPEAFAPPPKVRSSVVQLDILPAPQVPKDELVPFFEVVRGGFKHPRKQLHNSLSAGLWLPPGGADEALGIAGIDPMRRPQTLSIEEWYRVYRAVTSVRAAAKETVG